MGIAWPPDEMGAKGAGAELVVVRGEHGLLGKRLTPRVVRVSRFHPGEVVRAAFVDIALIAARERDARARGVDQPWDFGHYAGVYDVLRATDVGGFKRTPV